MQEKNPESQLKDGEIVVLSKQNVVDTTDDIIALAERRLDKIQRLKQISLKSTNEYDWVDQQGKPYLTSSGAEKIARLFGVKITNVKSEKTWSEDEKGRFYFYVVTGVSHLPGGIDSIEAVGTCSSKDQFFAKVRGELKPVSEVDETNIMKAAYSNFIANAVTRLLGIRNLTWDQIKSAGVAVEKVAKVEYTKGLNGGGQVTKEDKDKQVELGNILIDLAHGDQTTAENLLEDITKFTAKDGNKVKGIRSCKILTGKRLEIAIKKAKDKQKEEQGGGANDTHSK